MALKKCPRCELNYCRNNAEYCDVCLRELAHIGKGKEEQDEGEVIMCSECGDNPVVPGHDLCLECLKEQKRLQDFENNDESDDDDDDFSDTEEDDE